MMGMLGALHQLLLSDLGQVALLLCVSVHFYEVRSLVG